MRPDSKNPGSVESAVNVENLNVQNNSSELNSHARTESQPQPSASGQNHQSSQNVIQNNPHTAQAQISQQPGESNYFENQIAQLPAEESDIIEQHWVDKAKEIETKAGTDPYSEDEAQHALSRAYLKKRFNVNVE